MTSLHLHKTEILILFTKIYFSSTNSNINYTALMYDHRQAWPFYECKQTCPSNNSKNLTPVLDNGKKYVVHNK